MVEVDELLPAVAVIPTVQAATGPDLPPLTVTDNSGGGEALHPCGLGVSGDKLGYVDDAGTWPRLWLSRQGRARRGSPRPARRPRADRRPGNR